MNGLLATIALVGATVLTGADAPIDGATVVIDGNRIVAVGVGVAVPAGAQVIDVTGSTITPGLIDAVSRLGVDEVSLEPTAVEGTLSNGDPVRAALRVLDGFDPGSFVIPVARSGGLTSAVVVPEGGVISGQSIFVDLVQHQPVRRESLALHINLTGGNERGGRSAAFLRLREVLEDARLYRANRGPYITRKLRELSVSALDLGVLERALERELLVAIEVDRAPDILSALAIVREHRLNAVLIGVGEGWAVAEEIARAGVPVLVDPLSNLPSSFNQLRARRDNAARLHAAGVTVGLTLRGDAHRANRLRYAAGNAVAEGLPYSAAIAAITRVPAEIFGVSDTGTVRVGALANLVVWNGDPLEVGTWATRLFIRGQEVPLRSRQDLLTERYSGEARN